MWICLADAFLSIVADCRTRRQGEIETVFPHAIVLKDGTPIIATGPLLPRSRVAAVIATKPEAIEYGNFKNSVKATDLHDAYLGIWSTMRRYQQQVPGRP
jgi:hypothetical protein